MMNIRYTPAEFEMWKIRMRLAEEESARLAVPTRDYRGERYWLTPLVTLRDLLANTRDKQFFISPNGIYFLIRERRVVHVGQAVRGVWNRVNTHYKAHKKIFDCWSFVRCAEFQANCLERRYISEFWPEYNLGTKPKTHPKHSWVDGWCRTCGVETLGAPESEAPCPLCDTLIRFSSCGVSSLLPMT